MNESLRLPEDPDEAVRALREASREAPVLLLKKSPVCPVSRTAETELRHWLEKREGGATIRVARLDVVAERALARGITDRLGIAHASPQMVIFKKGTVCWHGSHYDLSEDILNEYL
ncbi:MAG: DUF2847 family protein [Candidatus Eisenbacteria bacterium]|nr:DUF2847 family protein [Candidatus Eisenbacteria bacterium]